MEDFFIQPEALELTQNQLLIRLLVATGIGFVIGFEREHASLNDPAKSVAGLRTFIFIVLLGFITTYLSFFISPLIFIAGFFGIVVIVGISYWITASDGDLGGTSELAIFLAYLLGAMTLLGYIEVSLALTVVMVVLLSLKLKFQNIIGQVTQDELYAFIQFVVLALLIFPFLPNQTYGPYDVFNPRELGWVIVLTSGLGFFGYVLMKFLGPDKGILITGILGGLVSSTMVTWIFSKKSKDNPEVSSHCAVAILLASTIMVLRVIVWIIIFNQDLLQSIIVPLAFIFFAGLGVAFYFYREKISDESVKTTVPLGKPLNLDEAIFFGVLYTGVLLLVSYANSQFGAEGIYVSSTIAALTDIDAITISMSKLAGESVEFLVAQNAIILATLSNTIVKIGIALSVGSEQLKKHIVIGYGAIFIAGLLAFIWLNFMS